MLYHFNKNDMMESIKKIFKDRPVRFAVTLFCIITSVYSFLFLTFIMNPEEAKNWINSPRSNSDKVERALTGDDELTKKIEGLESSLVQVSDDLKKERNKSSELMSKIESLEIEKGEETDKYVHTIAEKKECKSGLKPLLIENDELNKEIINLKNQLNSRHFQHDSKYRSKNDNLEAEIKRLKDQLNKRVNSLKSKNDSCTSELNNRIDLYKKKEKEYEALDNKYQQCLVKNVSPCKVLNPTTATAD